MNQSFEPVELEIVEFSLDDITANSLCPTDNLVVCETNDCRVD